MCKIDKGIRLTNYLIDVSLITTIWTFFLVLFANKYNIGSLEYYLLFFLYYFLFELFLDKTIGKMITKTIVVDKRGNRPSIFKIFLRSFLRLIPIDAFSYLFGTEYGFHDSVSSTKIISTK